MDAAHVLADILTGREATARILQAADAEYGDFPLGLASQVRARLEDLGISRLYSHQAKAVESALRGRDVMVVTGTSSGKTLCYNLPVLHHCATEPLARALYLFPTKALAQDQLGKLEELAGRSGPRVGVYDGDTARDVRSMVRREAQIVLTNPDMLHVGILPQHELWTKFFRSLRTVVVDEAHTYRGVFGGHVGWVLRRLLRLCAWHGSHPQVIACSATVAEPSQLFAGLTGRVPVVVDEDGSPRGEKALILVAPSDPESPETVSPNVESARILADMAARGVKAMVFCRARVSTELVVRTARKYLEGKGLDPALVDSYRGGYTAEERREIEGRLFRGELLGLATTNAMELGVDVGGLDAVVMNGYPGRLSSFWQQAGRAGRAGRGGLAVMLAHADPLEQFLAHSPDLIFDRGVEASTPSVWNPMIVSSQLRCAAYERPVGFDEVAEWGVEAVAEGALAADDLREAQGRLFYPSHEAPASKVNIRGAGGDGVRLMVDGEALGEMEYWRALQGAHAGAVYLHRGESYLVTGLELDRRVAILERAKTDYYTAAIVQSVVEPGVVVETAVRPGMEVQFLGLEVTTAVTGYRKMRLDGQTVLGEEALALPPQSFSTVGVRVDFDGDWLSILEPETMMVVHSLEHALMALAPLRAGCDRRDLGSAWYAVAPDTMRASLYVFDDTPGGLGLSERLFREFGGWLGDTVKLLEGCGCEDGCPLCLLSSNCEAGNEPLGKRVTLRWLLRAMADRDF